MPISQREYHRRLRENCCLSCGKQLTRDYRESVAIAFDARTYPIRCDDCAQKFRAQGESAYDAYFVV